MSEGKKEEAGKVQRKQPTVNAERCYLFSLRSRRVDKPKIRSLHQARCCRTSSTMLVVLLIRRLMILLQLGYSVHVAAAAAAAAAASLRSIGEEPERCPCRILDRPDMWKKEHVARWMLHTMDWGVLSTISSRLPQDPDNGGSVEGAAHATATTTSTAIPFGNVYSFVDGKCETSTGTPYFYGTFMDQTFRDMKSNPSASLTLTEASLASVCGGGTRGGLPACSISWHHGRYGDPESPICARLTLTGTLAIVDPSADQKEEHDAALGALYERHPQMSKWPTDHDWVVAKLIIHDVWFIDYFGGATVLSLDDFFAVDLFASKMEVEDAN